MLLDSRGPSEHARAPGAVITSGKTNIVVPVIDSMEELNSNGRPRVPEMPDLLYTITGDV